ncbi:helix-turn-helix domain-containing protein [Glacieibacterium frigidum]|uniref:AraC family transcriptional regulator n=1 Tax=Glacieibacterium frigidum TaxID=2593303 RepID=A0A552U9Y2_9SPHN|nr:helix-turn-helix domain-containing protein [Glacieibacterium frigidum]TRW15031.1 AraC family transcriptional regulator [Glacieibacterium frigidum]
MAETGALAVRMLRPAEALRGLVDAYYIVATEVAVADQLLAGPGNIRFTLAGEWRLTSNGVHIPTPPRAALFGPTDRAATFASTGAAIMLGAGLTPTGWAQLFDVAASTLRNRVCELADVAGDHDTARIDAALAVAPDDAGIAAALDAWLIARAAARRAADPRIAAVHRALLAAPVDVPGFAAAAGVSERTLHRLCLRALGFAPKALLRQKRFLRTLERVRGVLDRPLSGLIDDGYVDQSHFNRDFRYFMGTTPTAYFDSPREIMRRAAVARRTATGRGLQGLHPAAA